MAGQVEVRVGGERGRRDDSLLAGWIAITMTQYTPFSLLGCDEHRLPPPTARAPPTSTTPAP